MKKTIVILSSIFFSLSLYPSTLERHSKVIFFNLTQFKDGVSKLKDDTIKITQEIDNKAGVNAGFPNPKLKERWLKKRASLTCVNLMVQNALGLNDIVIENLEYCADLNESVVSYEVDPTKITYTCIANKSEFKNKLFPNAADGDTVVEVTKQ